jgi:UDP-4-amino-4,6-dideoxy-N-acetyl-beta-L-altrosamine transaminase
MIPYGRQTVTDDDVAAVEAVLRSDFLTQGPAVPRFEQAVADRVGAAHGVAANSATSALHVAYAALGLGPGDVLWTSPITFVATANAARMCGADVDFVDADPRTALMDPADLAERLHRARRDGARLPKIVVPVHMAGRSCDMAAVGALADEFGFRVVEDASHAVGATHDGAPVGACAHSDVSVFSFHPVKIITTGEGGLALTNDAETAAAMRRLTSHGITRDPDRLRTPAEGAWVYEQHELGFNYRLTDLQAALGYSQLQRLDSVLEARRALVRRWELLLADVPVGRPDVSAVDESAWHLYVVDVVDGRADGWAPGREARARVFAHMRGAGVGVQVHYIPVHLQPYYADLGFKAGAYPGAERYYAGALSLPLFPGLSDADQDRAATVLAEALAG